MLFFFFSPQDQLLLVFSCVEVPVKLRTSSALVRKRLGGKNPPCAFIIHSFNDYLLSSYCGLGTDLYQRSG